MDDIIIAVLDTVSIEVLERKPADYTPW